MSWLHGLGYLFGLILGISSAHADTTFTPNHFIEKSQLQGQRVLVAQWEGDDSYDPFADYSEFEETEDEEADINFFRNGRLFTLSLAATYRGFTGQLGNIYDPQSAFGIYLTYFFDLRFALVVGFVTGESGLLISSDTGSSVAGTVSMTGVTFNLKYFINTQNVTRGLAQLNPYVIGGITQFHRKVRFDDFTERFSDSAVGVDIGIGIEVPILRGQFYFGLQGIYHYVNFSDEGQEIILEDDTETGIKPAGDIFSGQAILGLNF